MFMVLESSSGDFESLYFQKVDRVIINLYGSRN